MQDQKRVCKSCGLEKICNPGKLGTNGSTVYHEESGKWWKSGVCSACQAKKRRDDRAAKKPVTS